MKNIARFLMVALLVIVATFAVSAVSVEVALEEVGDNVYNLQAFTTTSDENLYVNVFDLKITLNTNKIQLYSNLDEMVLPVEDIVDFYSDAVEMGPGASRKHTHDYVTPVINGDYVTLQLTSHAASASVLKKLPMENFHVWNLSLYIEGGVASLTEDDFAIEHVFIDAWDGADAGAKYGAGSWAEPVAGQIAVENNVIPEAEETKLTIAVAAGDVVYLQDGTVVEIAEANEAYEIPTTAGTVVVNSGFAGQKVYTVADNKVTEDTAKADGVLSTNEASIRDDETASGIRFKSSFLTSLKSVVSEYGYITTVESAYNALPADYVLNMALVDEGKAVKDVAYNANTDIFWNVEDDKTIVTAVVTNVPMTKEGVTTNIVIRPYYMVGEFVVYGEPMTRTVYEVALNIKENDADTYAKYQKYIDEILALCEETDVVIDFGPLFK